MRFDKFYNGIGKSAYDQSGFHNLVSCDIKSNIGKVKSGLALAKESGTTVTELCKNVVVDTVGNSYWFSTTSGKTWKRTSGGVWSLANTNANGACDGAAYYNGYIYYVSGINIGRFDLSSTWNDSWDTLNTTAADAPMVEQNLQLFIGNSRVIASINSSGTLNKTALDLPVGQVVKALATYETDLIIGTKVASDVRKCGVYRWDTYSDSWTIDDQIEVNGVNIFIYADNNLLAQIGSNADIYSYNGAKMEKYLQLRNGDTAVNVTLTSSANISGTPIFATGKGIFSFSRPAPDMDYAQNIEYISSQGQSITVGGLAVVGTTVLFAWEDGSSHGVDALSANRASGVITTPIAEGSFNNVIVKYSSLPAGTSIAISTKVDDGDWTAQTVITDTIRKICYFDGGLGTVNTLQAKVTLTSSGTSTPEVEFVEFV